MPTEKPSKSPSVKETWLDPPWTQPGDPAPQRLFTRDELAERLRILNLKTTAADLRYWEAKGILPQAIRRRHEGATRTLYPDWYGFLVRRLRQLQGAGYPLRLIKDKIRGEAPLLIRSGAPEDLVFPTGLSTGLSQFVGMYEETTGGKVARVEVRLINADESGTAYAYDRTKTNRPGFSAYPIRRNLSRPSN